MSVLRGRLVSSCSSLPSNPCPHVLSCHSSTVPPAVSLRVSSHRFPLFQQKCLSTGCAAGRQQGCEAFRMTATNCFCMRSSMFLLTDPAKVNNTRQTSAPTHNVHGRQTVFFVCVQEKQVKSDNVVEHSGRATHDWTGWTFLCFTSTTPVPRGCQDESALGSTETSHLYQRAHLMGVFDICHDRVCNVSDKDCSVSSS